ncbi:unnamed protein product [Adineta ricciae]|uniref:Uncharacterized protein n=2 Tax=Adineta ricciae TaxID=249248 RepID=A0A813X1C3_ADIRI|nr:unnamed protein product [Adineta ricciae]
MGNNSSTPTKKKPIKKKQQSFCCPCFSGHSASSASLSSDEKYFPTFDRIKSNDKTYPSPPLVINAIPSTSIHTPNEIDKNLSSAKNRRSVSLHNVISTVPDNANDNQNNIQPQCKPPLPPGKSRTVTKLPPTGRSFRGTLAETKRSYYSQSIEHARLSIEDLEKSLHGASSIDQWIDSLRILGTPSLNRNKATRTVVSTNNNKKIKRSRTIGDECDDSENILNGSYRQENCALIDKQSSSSKPDFPHILTLKFNRDFLSFAKSVELNFHFQDFLTRIASSKAKQTFKHHFQLATIIYPFAGADQILADDLNLFHITPFESILPALSSNTHSTYKTCEQIRSKCYFVPGIEYKIEADDEEYRKKRIELDRTHVVITLENKTKESTDSTTTVPPMKKAPVEQDSPYILTSDDFFQTGFIRIEQEKIPKQLLSFIYHSSETNLYYLSSNLIQQWFHTMILVNQTCAIAKRFLTGDGSHITCLIKQQSNHTNSLPSENNITFAALRLPPCLSLSDSLQTNLEDEDKSCIIDAFSSTFLSDNKKTATDTIHIDYEQYSFAFLVQRWPKALLDNYYTDSKRNCQRKWPSKYHLNIIIKKPLLLIPSQIDHQWKTNFDLIEQSLFELMNESTICFYVLCQQLLCQTIEQRPYIKHCFLNYCEKYGLPFSNHREHSNDNIHEMMVHFLKEIHLQLTNKFLPNHFNHQVNLYETTDSYNQWTAHLNQCLNDRIRIPTPSSTITISNRPVIMEFLFHFIDQLYQTFHIKRSQFHLNEHVLLDLHKQLCEKLSNDTNNNNSTTLQKFITHLLNNQQLVEQIQTNLTYDFETNAELVHTCLNQVRKADSSLIFHYTWTIYIQYLHTYYNVLWNI